MRSCSICEECWAALANNHCSTTGSSWGTALRSCKIWVCLGSERFRGREKAGEKQAANAFRECNGKAAAGACLLRAGTSLLVLSALSGELQISNAAIRAFTITLMETAD